MKAIIIAGFHRYVGTGEFITGPKAGGKPGETERAEVEREQRFPPGKTVIEGDDGVTADDIRHWIAVGYATEVPAPIPAKAVE